MGSLVSRMDHFKVSANWYFEKEEARKNIFEYVTQLNVVTSAIVDENQCYLLFDAGPPMPAPPASHSSSSEQAGAGEVTSSQTTDREDVTSSPQARSRGKSTSSQETDLSSNRRSRNLGPSLPPWNRIKCDKVHKPTGEIKDSRILILDEFLRLRYLILEHSSLASCPDQLLSTLDSFRTVTGDSLRSQGDSMCCVCYVQHVNIVLPCLHAYCSQCISEWEQRNPTCPNCRANIDINDGWVLSEAPRVDPEFTSSGAGNAVVAASEKLGVRRNDACQQRRSLV